MKNKWFLVVFLLIFFVGSFFRFYQLGAIPESMDWDEVSFGYNAYSILHTGMDEYGVSYPFAFRAFGEYKQPVYAYLDVISIGLFGLNAFAVRFPSAFFGSLSIIFVYLLTYELFRKQKFVKNIAFLAMAFYVVSPWSIQFSRAAFEANVSLCLVIASVWLFLKGLSLAKQWYLYGATLLLVVSEYTYISQKLLGPLLFIALLIYSYSYLKKQKIVIGCLVFLFLVGNIFWVVNTASVTRGQTVLFTSQQSQFLQSSISELQYDTVHHDVFGEFVHNRRVVYAQKFLENYFSHYNPVWLFFTGDTVNRHHAPGMGNLYLISFPFILLGIFFLFSRAFATSWIIFFWFLIAPFAASLTIEVPQSLRSLIFLPTWQIFEAAGVIYLFKILTIKRLVPILKIIIVGLYVVSILYYSHQYFVHTNTDSAVQKDWQFGYKEAAVYVSQFKHTDKRVVFEKEFEQPYIFYLFYTQYDPKKYLSSGSSWRTTNKCYAIDNIYFGDCTDKLRTGDIAVALGVNPTEKGMVMKRIMYTDGEPAITIYQQP